MSELIEVPQRWRCRECDWIGETEDIIRFEDPEGNDNFWNICPDCRSAEQFQVICWKCEHPAGMGTPALPYRYIWTCHKHNPGST